MAEGDKPEGSQPFDMQKAINKLVIGERELPRSAPRTEREAQERDYKFWKTQPVPGLNDTSEADVNEPVEADKDVAEIRQQPLVLPAQFAWSNIDASDEAQLNDLYELLRDNYVEDDDMTFRFDYSREFLKWVLLPPGYKLDWLVGVRVKSNNKLVGFISGIPVHIRIYSKTLSLAEVNFLCVHKKLRSKRLAPVLIKEVTRRINLTGIFQAVYTAGVVLPKPISKCRYFHRPIQHKKLLECGFTVLAPNVTMQRFMKLYKLPEEAPVKGIRKAEEKDLEQIHTLLEDYLKRFSLVPVFVSLDEIRHYLLPREGVISTYVIEDLETKKITDFFSFYHLPSSIVRSNSQGHKRLYAAYSYYNVCTTHSLQDVLQSALIIAKEDGIDVFNALDIMENSTVLRYLKFGAGDGYLRFYLYNWRCSDMPSNQVGLVLQ
ncbi:glycylpeptide N-tetradecanoyltransferase 1-like [Sycon ciliatum]|uniref:glycylpeptide N-tetradecanoyltransferase 1-like n=1 Tax=Sycon ciliatum TaxID=27933 RepID=UPI0031F680F0